MSNGESCSSSELAAQLAHDKRDAQAKEKKVVWLATPGQGAVWFNNYADAHARATTLGHKFEVARDGWDDNFAAKMQGWTAAILRGEKAKKPIKAWKQFSSFKNHAEYLDAWARTRPALRNFYEYSKGKKPCRTYLDIEGYKELKAGELPPTQEQEAEWLEGLLSGYVCPALDKIGCNGTSPEFDLAIGSRMDDEEKRIWKTSFHAATDAALWADASVQLAWIEAEIWPKITKDERFMTGAQGKCVLDITVYKDGQQMRMPGNHKGKAGLVPDPLTGYPALQMITGGMTERMLMQIDPDVVSTPMLIGLDDLVKKGVEVHVRRKSTKKAPRASSPLASSSCDSTRVPKHVVDAWHQHILTGVMQLLRARGDGSSVPYAIKGEGHDALILCKGAENRQFTRGRPKANGDCGLSCAEPHKTDNLFIPINLDAIVHRAMNLVAFCHKGDCLGESGIRLGVHGPYPVPLSAQVAEILSVPGLFPEVLLDVQVPSDAPLGFRGIVEAPPGNRFDSHDPYSWFDFHLELSHHLPPFENFHEMTQFMEAKSHRVVRFLCNSDSHEIHKRPGGGAEMVRSDLIRLQVRFYAEPEPDDDVDAVGGEDKTKKRKRKQAKTKPRKIVSLKWRALTSKYAKYFRLHSESINTPLPLSLTDAAQQRQQEHAFNLWAGFKAQNTIPSEPPADGKWRLKMDTVLPLLFLMWSRLCNWDLFMLRYTLTYLSQIVRTPWLQTEVFLFFVTENAQRLGGKSFVFEFFGNKVIGEPLSYEASGTAEFLDPFNDHLTDCVFIWVNEMSAVGADAHRAADKIKGLITGKKTGSKAKYAKAKRVDSHVNMAGASNHVEAISLEKGDDRTVVWATNKTDVPSGTHPGTGRYLGAQSIDRPSCAGEFLQMLLLAPHLRLCDVLGPMRGVLDPYFTDTPPTFASMCEDVSPLLVSLNPKPRSPLFWQLLEAGRPHIELFLSLVKRCLVGGPLVTAEAHTLACVRPPADSFRVFAAPIPAGKWILVANLHANHYVPWAQRQQLKSVLNLVWFARNLRPHVSPTALLTKEVGAYLDLQQILL